MNRLTGLLIAIVAVPHLSSQIVQGPRVPATGTYANRPTSPPVNTVYIVTNDLSAGACAGGGTARSQCQWTGIAWVGLGGTGGGGTGTPGGAIGSVQLNAGGGNFGGQSSIFSSGTTVQRAVECTSGTVNSTALNTSSPSQEITIQTGMSSNVNYEQITLSETTQFTGTTGLTVSMGRPGGTDAEMTAGAGVPLMLSSGDLNFYTFHPAQPTISASYSLVLNFAVTSGNVNAATGGVVTYTICGYLRQ